MPFLRDTYKFLKQRWPLITMTGLAVAIPMVGKYYLDKSIGEIIHDPKFNRNPSKTIINKLMSNAKLNMPYKIVHGYGNAFYVPPNTVSDKQQQIYKKISRQYSMSKDKNKKVEGDLLGSVADLSKSEHGGIVMGDKLKNPYVIAHEVGHAKIRNDGGFYGFIQDHAQDMQSLGVASLLGSLVPKFLGYNKIGNAMFYGGAGSLLAGLGGEILYEHKANELAKQFIDKIKYKDELGKKLLSVAEKTYYNKGLKYSLPLIPVFFG